MCDWKSFMFCFVCQGSQVAGPCDVPAFVCVCVCAGIGSVEGGAHTLAQG